MIDSHCHLTDNYENLTEVIQTAQQAGVSHLLNVGCSYAEWQPCVACIEKYPVVFGAVGLHPEVLMSEIDQLTDIIPFLNHPKMVAVGEIGLDYVCADMSHKQQWDLFERQIQIALSCQMPVIIHTRAADEDTIAVLNAYKNSGLTGVLHCFCGSERLAQTALETGFYLSASGMITFKKSDFLRAIFQTIPAERLLIETDAPYLAPVPHRGQQNQPAFVAHTLQVLADLKEVSAQEMDQQTTYNFFNLFTKARKDIR